MSRTVSFFYAGYQFTVIFTCDSFRDYIIYNEDNNKRKAVELTEEYEKLEKEIFDAGNSYSEEYAEHLKDSLQDEYHKIENDFKYRFRESLVIQLYSFMEDELNRLCFNLAHLRGEVAIWEGTKGDSDLHKIKNYLFSQEIDLSKDNPMWIFINEFRKMRRCIVHNGALFDGSERKNKSLLQFAKGHFTLKPYHAKSKFSEIVLDDVHFLFTCIDNVEKFMMQVMQQSKL